MPDARRHRKTRCISMILKMSRSHGSKKNLLKVNEKGKSKSEMHRCSIFDRFGIDFGAIFESKIKQKLIAKRP